MPAIDDTATAPRSSNGARIVAKRRGKPVERFPLAAHTRISIPMSRSLERLTAGYSLFGESEILRMALHQYLLASDPQYRVELGAPQREVGGNA
jgi:hypothetical protein